MTIISRRDPIVVAPPGSGRTYSIVPLTFRARAAMKADLVRETGQPVFREQLQTARRSALQEIGPTNLADLMALLDEIEAQLGQGTHEPEVCLHMFGRLIGASLSTHQEMLTVTSIVVKEQMHPTKAFDILYEGCLERLHQVGARLIEAYTGEPPGQQETVLRFHALLGQSLAFRFARETVVRRAGWTDIGPPQVDLIEQVVTEQVCDALRGLRWRRQGGDPR